MSLTQSTSELIFASGGNPNLVSVRAGLVSGQATAGAEATISTPSVGAPINSGKAIYDAQYAIVGVRDVTVTRVVGQPTEIKGTPFATIGTQSVTLNANFDSGTLTGSTPLMDVNGTISGQTLGGSVSVNIPVGATNSGPFRPLSATLEGEIGSTAVVGGFAGHDDTAVVAGGFVGNKR
jgi:hypothetical protein